MSQGFNDLYFSGHLGKDPEFFTTANGEGVRFVIGQSDNYRDRNGQTIQRPTLWMTFTAWNGWTKVLQGLTKGHPITVHAEAVAKEDFINGKKNYYLNWRVKWITVGMRNPNGAYQNGQGNAQNHNFIPDNPADEVPFDEFTPSPQAPTPAPAPAPAVPTPTPMVSVQPEPQPEAEQSTAAPRNRSRRAARAAVAATAVLDPAEMI